MRNFSLHLEEFSYRTELRFYSGFIGVLQALEAIKIITGSGTVLNKQMLTYNGLDHTIIRARMRGRQKHCRYSVEIKKLF